jgi:hypothetical protein
MSRRQKPRDVRASNREQPENQTKSEPPAAAHSVLFAVALFLVVVGARWWLIGNYGTDVPWLDQWDAEAQGLYQPWQAGTLGLQNWFAPHNEHRIFFTRVLSFCLLRLNGQWDPRLQMVANASFYGGMVAAIFLVLQRGRSRRFQWFCWFVLALLGVAPYAATNTLLGFQSQFYFLAGFSLLAIYLLVNRRAGTKPWLAGVLSGFAALVSMASGYAAAVAVLGVLACTALRRGKDYGRQLSMERITIIAASLMIAAGLLLRYQPPDHAVMEAKSIGEFVSFLVTCLSWPGSSNIALALISWTPFAVFLASYLRGSTRDDDTERFVLGIGIWVLLQAAALAMYRANSGEGLESRYTDILAFGLLTNAVCAVWMIGSGGKLRKAMPILAVVWGVVASIGIYTASFNGVAASWKHDMEIRRAATAGYLATGNQQLLQSAPPYHDPKRLASILDDPKLREILPAGINRALTLAPAGNSPAPDFLNGVSTPDLATPGSGVWNWPGVFTRFAVIPPSTPFEYRIETRSRAGFLLLYVLGNDYTLTATGSTVPLPGDGQGHHAFFRCPGSECALHGRSGSSQLAIAEPKAIGLLSIAALYAGLWGQYVVLAGCALLLFRAIPRRS